MKGKPIVELEVARRVILHGSRINGFECTGWIELAEGSIRFCFFITMVKLGVCKECNFLTSFSN
jgi:hypothetical protein